MSITQRTTADDLPRISAEASTRGQRCELVAGKLRMMSPGGWKHGGVIGRLHSVIGGFIHMHDLGVSFGAETGFLLESDPDTVRAPDFAFIAKTNLPAQDPEEVYWPGAPDFAVEVLSPNDRTGEVDAKIHAWLAAGVKLLWVVDPDLKTVTAYRSTTDIIVYVMGDVIDSIDVLPGCSLTVSHVLG